MRSTQNTGTAPRKGFRHLPKVVKSPPVDALLQRGADLQAAGRLEEAAAEYRTAIARFPHHAAAYSNLGTVHQAWGMLDEALLWHAKALAIDPLDGRIHVNIGACLKLKNRLPEAADHYRAAVAWFETHDPHNNFQRTTANLSLAETLLARGEFAAAWPFFEWRHKLPLLAKQYVGVRKPMWQGESLEGRHLLVMAEQGLGDSLQFFRYLPAVRERAARVTLIVPLVLQTLAREIPGIEVVSCAPVYLSYDLYCPLMSLPRCFGTTLETIPSRVPYLTVPAAERDRAAALPRASGKLRVALVWAGNPVNPNDGPRSIPFHVLEPLWNLEGAQFFPFQLGRGEELEIARWRGACDPGLEPGNMAYTAALLARMDLVLTIDSALAHLAGALGIPTWLMLPSPAEWRWMADRDDSPWYPTMRLFRQRAPRDWTGVIEAVRAALVEKMP